MQLAQKLRVGDIQLCAGHPFAAQRLATEDLEALAVQIVHRDAVHGHIFPAGAGLAHDELRKRDAGQLLFGAAAAVVVLPTIADGIGAGADTDLDVLLPVPLQQIHVGHDAHGVADLVWDILQSRLLSETPTTAPSSRTPM